MTLLLSTAFLPPVNYFAAIIKAENVFIEKHETYLKQSYRNRCCIYSPNGMQSLVIPVTKPEGNKTSICDIQISNSADWQRLHWRAIETAYNSSPYFLYYKDDLFPFFNTQYDNLLDFNTKLLLTVIELIGFAKPIQFTSAFERNPKDFVDLRYSLSPKINIEKDMKPYTQVFSHKSGFIPNLSIIDLIFNLGPDTLDYLYNS